MVTLWALRLQRARDLVLLAGPASPVAPEVAAALAAVSPAAIEHHMSVLADDSMMGRAPRTEGIGEVGGLCGGRVA